MSQTPDGNHVTAATLSDEPPLAAAPAAPNGRPPAIDEYVAGKLSIILATGLSYRQAERWVRVCDDTIGEFAQQPGEFAEELKDCTQLARLHPFLRLYLATANSWQASAWFYQFVQRRSGEAPVDALLAAMLDHFEHVQWDLYPDELGKISFDAHYPIGEM